MSGEVKNMYSNPSAIGAIRRPTQVVRERIATPFYLVRLQGPPPPAISGTSEPIPQLWKHAVDSFAKPRKATIITNGTPEEGDEEGDVRAEIAWRGLRFGSKRSQSLPVPLFRLGSSSDPGNLPRVP
jgi:hypothetical protein